MKREFLLVAFGLCVGAFILVIQFFVNPLNWVSPIKWQWLVAVVVIVLVVGMTIYIIRGVRKIDKDNETKQVAMLKKALESNNAKLAKAIGKALVEAGLAKREAKAMAAIKPYAGGNVNASTLLTAIVSILGIRKKSRRDWERKDS